MDGSQTPPEARTIPELISMLTGDLANLVRKESELIRAELSEKVRHAGRAAGEIAFGGLLLVAALFVLLDALVAALATLIGPIWSALAVGVSVAVLGLILIRTGKKMLSPESLSPDRTARQLQKDAQLMKGR